MKLVLGYVGYTRVRRHESVSTSTYHAKMAMFRSVNHDLQAADGEPRRPNRTRAADDFSEIQARLQELWHERTRVSSVGLPPQPTLPRWKGPLKAEGTGRTVTCIIL